MADLAQVRRQANAIRSHMRQGKYVPAIQALYDTVLAMLKTPLMKSEREEFERLISDGTHYIMADQTVRRTAALELNYKAGQERELLEKLHMMLEVFQDHMHQEAADIIRMVKEKRERELARAQALLDAARIEEARVAFASISSEAHDDAEVRADIGERFLRAKYYKDAADYLGEAIAMMPEAVHLYNSLAMAQRKVGMYAEAEQCYLKAAQYGARDSHLLFNMGRLYLDWEKWDKAVKAAQGALMLDEHFEEARKLKAYAEKKLMAGG